jgi:hypothetical protein
VDRRATDGRQSRAYLIGTTVEKPMVDIIAQLKMADVRELYDSRESAHAHLSQLLAKENVEDYVNLALGITSPAGNYSAHEHRLGPMILNESTHDDVFELATEIDTCQNPRELPQLIYQSRLPYLKISVGSEIAMMLKPDVHWVGNVRTIWSHLLIKHKGDRHRANQELKLYRDNDRESEMDYQIWKEIYPQLEANLLEVGRLADAAAAAQNVTPGPLRFMWPDAVASFLFDQFADPR